MDITIFNCGQIYFGNKITSLQIYLIKVKEIESLVIAEKE